MAARLRLIRPGFCIRFSKILRGFRDAIKKEYTVEFKDQAVRFVLEEIEPDESRKHACERLGSKLSVKPVTLYNWLKQASPAKARPSASPGSWLLIVITGSCRSVARCRSPHQQFAR